MVNYWNLDSGAKLVIEEIPYIRSAALGIYIKVGSRHETLSLSGASHFVEHMLFKGTKKRTAREIAESFENIGGQINAFTAKEYTCLYARTLDEYLYNAMDIMFDMLFQSSFELKDFETEKGVIIEEINMYEDTPDDLIHDIFSQQLWQGYNIGRPILGTLESVSAFTRDDIFDYYKRAYCPANIIIAVAGNVDVAKVKDKVESYLNEQNWKTCELFQDKTSTHYPFVKLIKKDIEQIQICLGGPGISYRDNKRYTQNIMNSILGGGASSRLFQAIREELGLAYSVYSYSTNYSDSGAYVIYIGTGASKVPQFFEALHAELSRFIGQGVSEEEVVRTKRLMKAGMLMGMESVMNRMSRLGKSILLYDKVLDIEQILDQINAVSAQMVNSLAAEILNPSQLSMAVIGSAEVLPGVESEFNKWWN
ncbi:MAG: M16 family metallopeptidase [Syntrophomonadaceae bacterium]